MTDTADRADLAAAVEDRLRQVGRTIRTSMLDVMPDGEPVQWLYGPMREYPSRPGKALRPALCMSAGRVFGGTADDLLGLAVAIELLHNAFLVHDDWSMAVRCGVDDRHWPPSTAWRRHERR